MAEDCEHGSWVYRCPVCARSQVAISCLTAERDSAQRAAAILEERSWYEWGRAEQAESERDAAITRAEEAERLAVWAVRNRAYFQEGGLISDGGLLMVPNPHDVDWSMLDCDGTDESILHALGEAAAMEGGKS